MTTLRHHIRNGAIGIYTERKKLLSEMLKMATVLESRRTRSKKQFIGELTESLRGQMACIRRIDLHLERVMKALIEQAVNERQQKPKREDKTNEKVKNVLSDGDGIHRGACVIRVRSNESPTDTSQDDGV